MFHTYLSLSEALINAPTSHQPIFFSSRKAAATMIKIRSREITGSVIGLPSIRSCSFISAAHLPCPQSPSTHFQFGPSLPLSNAAHQYHIILKMLTFVFPSVGGKYNNNLLNSRLSFRKVDLSLGGMSDMVSKHTKTLQEYLSSSLRHTKTHCSNPMMRERNFKSGTTVRAKYI